MIALRRGEMIVRGIYGFEHVGTQHPNNAEQNMREAHLGCYHAHRLFDGIKVNLKVNLKEGREFPESFSDYEVKCEWSSETLPRGVNLHLRHLQPVDTITLLLEAMNRKTGEEFGEEDLLPLAALADVVFCERRAAFHLIERLWQDNVFTAVGTITHQRVRSLAVTEDFRKPPYCKGPLNPLLQTRHIRESRRRRIPSFGSATCCIVACQTGLPSILLSGEKGFWQPYPVEYKGGHFDQTAALKSSFAHKRYAWRKCSELSCRPAPFFTGNSVGDWKCCLTRS